MRLQAEDVKEMAADLEGAFPGLSASVADKPLQQDPTRSMILSALQVLTEAAAGQAFLLLVARANSLLRDVEPGQSSDQILSSISAKFRAEFVIPSQKNAARVMLLVNAVLEQVRKRLAQTV